MVEVDPDDGVGADVLMRSVDAAASVLDAPRQQLLTTNVLPLPVPQRVVPLPLKTADTSAVFEAFTENPNCAFV